MGGRVVALTVATASVALAAALGGGALASGADGACAGVPRAPAGLPAPVWISTRCGRFAVLPDGEIVRRAAGRGEEDGPWPRGALDRSGDTWLLQRRGHLVVARGGKPLWRSAQPYRLGGTPHYLEATALGPRAVAFAFSDAELYVARFGGPERVAARGEQPLFWTAAGQLVTFRWDRLGSPLFLRAADGRLLGRLPERMVNFAVAEDRRTVVFVTPEGVLVRTDGVRVERLADVHELGEAGVELPGGGLIVVHSDSSGRLLAFDSDGRPLGATPVERWPSALAVSPDGDALALVVSRWSSDYQEGTDAVLVLRRGKEEATRLYEREQHGSPCGRGVTLAWHGDDLLFSTTEGALVALDTTGARPPVDLTETVAAMPGGPPRFSPVWEAAGPG